MEVGCRERYNCNICENSYVDYNLYVKHCQYTHVKIETESSGHVDYKTIVTNYTEGIENQTPLTNYTEGIENQTPLTNYTEGIENQTPLTNYTEGIENQTPLTNYTEDRHLSPVVGDNIFTTTSCNGDDLKMVNEMETEMDDGVTVSNSVSCGLKPYICDNFEAKPLSETENGVSHFYPVLNSMNCGVKSNNVNHGKSSFITNGQQEADCPESCQNSFIIKCEAEPKDCDLPPENKTQQDFAIYVKESRNNRLSNDVEFNMNLVKNEIKFDSLACENNVSQESDVDRGKTRELNHGLDFINSNSEEHGTNPEDDDGKIKTDMSDGKIKTELSDGKIKTELSDGEMKTDISEGEIQTDMSDGEIKTDISEGEIKTDMSTKLINCNKSLCIELTRIDYLLEDGIFTSCLMLPSDRASQGLEEHFEIKIERDEEADFDVPIDDMAVGTDVISNIKTEDGCEPVTKLEDVETAREEDLEEIQSKCYICYKKFANRSGMFRHLREVHKGMSKDDWEIYCEIKAKEKLMCRTCQICNTVFDTYQENKRHKLKHVQVKDFQCHVCGELFRQRQTMLNHVFRHTGVKQFQCEHCPITAYTRSQMKAHMRTHTKEKRFKCELCTSRFSSHDMLKIHMRSHTGEKPFKCDVCEKAFVSVTALKVHSALHTGVKKFQCQVCDKYFSQNIHLKTHARVHTGERPYSCTECDQKFGRKHHLDNHMRKHTGEKPFRCTACHQTFALKQYLVSHLRVHTGEKPYKCPVCHVGFSQYTEQKVHTKRHLKSDYVTPNRKLKKRRSARVKNTVLKYIDELDE